MKTSDIKVELLDVMGTDLSVVNAARVSFDKESDWDTTPFNAVMGSFVERVLTEGDEKLIHYLAGHNHWSPFAHTAIKFRIKAPIFVARQLVKHQVGGVWNEISRRYVTSEPEFYSPDVWRNKPKGSIKQGSGDGEVPFLHMQGFSEVSTTDRYHHLVEHALDLYNEMLECGVSPEQARMVLPQSAMTEWIWTGSLMFFFRVCKDRLGPTAQKETQEVADHIYSYCEDLFPTSWKALMENR